MCSSSGSALPGVAFVGTFLPAAASSAHGSGLSRFSGRALGGSGRAASADASGAPSSLEPPLSGPSVASESVSSLGARGRESARPAAARACRRAAGLEAPSAVIRILPDASGAVMVAGSTPPCAGKSSGRAAAAPGLRGGSCAVSWLGLGSGLGLG